MDLILKSPEENVFVIRGGQGASKTISIIQLIIQSMLTSEKEASIISSELSKMKRTVIRDYKKICKDWGVFINDTDFNKSESKHEYPNDSYLDFLGADVADIGKGFRRDIIYINEADKMDIETAIQFISRAGLTIIDYNPDKLFWGDDFINDRNFITLTFEDNEFLAESEVKSILEYKAKGFINSTLPVEKLFQDNNIKSKYWANKWKVYGLGLVGAIDGTIFQNWSIGEFDVSLPHIYGLDFGFSKDPDSMIKVAVDKKRKIIYAHEELYKTGNSTQQLTDLLKLKANPANSLIVADSADPRTINDLRQKQLNVIPAIKGPDSIRSGIKRIQDYEIIVTGESTNLIKELRNYVWHDKKSEMPIDAFNHQIDPLRYAFEYLVPQQSLYISGM